MSRAPHATSDQTEPAGTGIIGQSDAIQALRLRIAKVAPTDATVLVQGERGTGKELVARAVHAASGRSDRPFVAVNCAALPSDLLASELFGHERGAFTGALHRRAGLLVAAAGGTVFLDEIGDLSVAGQAMLLRFLQQREVRPLGSVEAVHVDIRVIAATNVDLRAAAADGRFRADLLDRLAEITVDVPALRLRRDDVPLLVEHFVDRTAPRFGRRVAGLRPDAWALVQTYDWPGNVRELEHAVTRAVVFAAGSWLCAEDFELGSAPRPNLAAVPAASTMPSLTTRQQAIAALARPGRVVRRADVRRQFAVSGETARRELGRLVEQGVFVRRGRNRAAVYHLAE